MNYLIAAYLIMWIVIFAYILNISRRQHRLEEEVTRLQQLLDKGKTN